MEYGGLRIEAIPSKCARTLGPQCSLKKIEFCCLSVTASSVDEYVRGLPTTRKHQILRAASAACIFKEACHGQSHLLCAINTVRLFQLVPGRRHAFPLHPRTHHKSRAANLAPAGETRGKTRVELGLAISVCVFSHRQYNPDAYGDHWSSH